MKKILMISIALVMTLLLSACGGSNINRSPNQPQPQPQPLVDPSGNWSWTFGTAPLTFKLGMALQQSGSTVTLASYIFDASGETVEQPSSNWNCPAALTLGFQNGTVANTDQFSAVVTFDVPQAGPIGGPITVTHLGSITINATLNSTGTTMAGTYSGAPSCTGLPATGAFSGIAVPSVTGTWSVTLTQCNPDPTGVCTPINGATPATMTWTLQQILSPLSAQGTWTASGVSALGDSGSASSGTSVGYNHISIGPGGLSGVNFGLLFQTTSRGANLGIALCTGILDQNGGYSGLLTVYGLGYTPVAYYLLTAAHTIS